MVFGWLGMDLADVSLRRRTNRFMVFFWVCWKSVREVFLWCINRQYFAPLELV